ncbi:potassium transporter [Endozoicomonas montiporae]|uniref:Trk system potassium uptake protein n=2 Tax=Endozoicomonas montiporae TaxID=1027273 RepID=A0A081N064_9GAMM|nr:TrkH family potassium uptake protein [Endozoicomonas montiporae]AMO54287.1 Trk system potassium uptake protein TrkH [Endozoicomonas montiporae CL-33]KEQ11837.1 potassium transporter [Endozoicomonas montiporae]
MQLSVVMPVLGFLLMVFSLSNIPPMIVGLIYGEAEISLFIYTFFLTLLGGMSMWLPYRKVRGNMKTRDGFVITVLFWLVLGLVGSLPFLMMDAPSLSITDAIFESMSGLTTTGATILTGLDDMPRSILFYRQQIQWFGGMGIIVLAVAIMPMLGIGGMQLYRTETPGPVKDSKLTPRIKETAKALWTLYVALTVTCAIGYKLAGMDWFDAISHSFSTIAIGGFSTHDASIGYFQSPLINAMTTFFMFFAGINFALHFFAWRNKTASHYFKDSEVKGYVLILSTVALITVFTLYASNTYGFWTSFEYGLFEVVSIATTTGYSTTGFSVWPTFLPLLLFITSFVGGCAGSTAGGMKVVRIMLIFKQGVRELYRLVHPNAILTIKLGGQPVNSRVGEAVWGFFATYVFLLVVMFLLLMATGLDIVTAFTTVASCLNNLGPALGDAYSNYQTLPDAAKWILTFAMLLGRLEIFTLLVLFTPVFWRY